MQRRETSYLKKALILLLAVMICFSQPAWAAGSQKNEISSGLETPPPSPTAEPNPSAEPTAQPNPSSEPAEKPSETEPEETEMVPNPDEQDDSLPQDNQVPTVTPTEEPSPSPTQELTIEIAQNHSPAEQKTGKWVKQPNGRRKFLYSDGKMAQNTWANIDGKWYYFDDKGYMCTGWHLLKKSWYYFHSSGSLVTGWLTDKKVVYYLNPTGEVGELGRMLTGWQTIGKYIFYFNGSGAMAQGFQNIKNRTYYFKKGGGYGALGRMLTGWHTISNKRYYFKIGGGMGAKGTLLTGFQKLDGWIYYLKPSGSAGELGRMQTGWNLINKRWYYFKVGGAKGRMLTGWQTLGGRTYYLRKDGALGVKGQMLTGFQKLDKGIYYFQVPGGQGVEGSMLTGWQLLGGYWYYFKTGGTKGLMLTGWQTLGGLTYYLKPSGSLGQQGRMVTGWQTISNKRYYFYAAGDMAKNTIIDGYSINSQGVATLLQIPKKTLKGFLKNAILPVGSTLYIWGGGHDDGDAMRIGLNPNWKQFYNSQNSNYDYSDYRYHYGKGLDCSGFVGWAVYNTLESKSNQNYYVAQSTTMPSWYARKGWGTYSLDKSASFKAGDVVGVPGHVWIVIGQCRDGSVVLVHCTPPTMQIAGTPTKSGNINSEAVKLAKSYMKKYYGSCVSKFHLSSQVDLKYLKGYDNAGVNHFRWDVTGNRVMKDPDGYSKMKADAILEDLFKGF